MIKVLQAAAIVVSLAGFGVIAGPAWAAFVGGAVAAVLLELHDVRKGGD